ncbi:hypothetical protein G647_02357 [Cladophialophora carrionii CBS 160.54]|uniref:LysM domain-containing protein n=1 Tax=Cladophialophora carrionii CBS 160.54 TaxID=1279043 RepID=V9DGY1_9EURO|nr:uncharacterized protein G647_02357 [Cladophialophora carrionii CBS 160.54]ETI25583.1 hypothetical protein G647_02357 [Cladophialophora carrionii CBS 160.54]
MNKWALILLLLASIVFADIHIQTFIGDASCDGEATIDKVTTAGNSDSTACVSAGRYLAVNVLSADPTFQCNFYSDEACQDLIGTLDTPGVCTLLTGTSLTCFTTSQPAVVVVPGSAPVTAPAPTANPVATVSTGKSLITVDLGGAVLVQSGVQTSCGATACDPTTPLTKPFQHLNEDCTLSVTMTGSYDNADERDYMSGLMQAAVTQTDTNSRVDTTGSAEDDDLILDSISFASVVLKGSDDNAIQAQMMYSVGVSCVPPANADCNSLEQTITSDLLSKVPGAGEVLSTLFEIFVCGES